jgi:hypothetical protein
MPGWREMRSTAISQAKLGRFEHLSQSRLLLRSNPAALGIIHPGRAAKARHDFLAGP